MATANFKHQNEFPLFVVSDEDVARHVLGDDFDEDSDEVLEANYWAWEIWNADFDYVADAFNATLMFHDVRAEAGYYDGCSIYIENVYDFDESWTNDECRYHLDMCRSEALRKFAAEKRRIIRWLRSSDELRALGFFEIEILGRFSNGETVYGRVDQAA